MKSSWISSFGLFTGGKSFYSVFGMLGLMLLPDILQGTQESHFFWMASVIRGHQKCRAAKVILLMAGCPLCSKLMTVVRRFFGTTMLSSMNTRPKLLDNFLLYGRYSSGISSCCCLSRHTSVFSRLASFVVSVMSNCKSVEVFLRFSHCLFQVPVILFFSGYFWSVSHLHVLDTLYFDIACPVYCRYF